MPGVMLRTSEPLLVMDCVTSIPVERQANSGQNLYRLKLKKLY